MPQFHTGLVPSRWSRLRSLIYEATKVKTFLTLPHPFLPQSVRNRMGMTSKTMGVQRSLPAEPSPSLWAEWLDQFQGQNLPACAQHLIRPRKYTGKREVTANCLGHFQQKEKRKPKQMFIKWYIFSSHKTRILVLGRLVPTCPFC